MIVRKTLIVKDVASLLHLHKITVSEMARKCVLPAYKVGGKWIFFLDEIEQFLQDKSNLNQKENDVLEKHSYSNKKNYTPPVSRNLEREDRIYRKALGLPPRRRVVK